MIITLHDIDDTPSLLSAIDDLMGVAVEVGQEFFVSDWGFSPALAGSSALTVEETAAVVGLEFRAVEQDPAPDQQALPFDPGPWMHPGPGKYVPCPNLGQHVRLLDCWMCRGDAAAANQDPTSL